jgi:hypothetical protein
MAAMTRALKMLGLLSLALVAGLAIGVTHAGAGGKKSAAKNACTKDKGCADCSGLGACTRTCEGGGCSFSHSGIGAAKFYCPDGKCVMNHSGTGQAVLHCPGGACKATCTGTGECKIVECKEGCAIECKGTGRCTST